METLPEAAQKEIQKLRLEVKKLSRQLASVNRANELFRASSLAQENLSRTLSAEKTLKEKHMALLLDNNPDIIFLLDERGRFVFSTQALLSVLGCAGFDSIRGKTMLEVFAPYLSPKLSQFVREHPAQAAQPGERAQIDHEIDFWHSGSPRAYHIQFIAVGPEGSQAQAEGTLIIMHDQTELVREKERAQSASRAKSDFLLSVSHEVRTPMNAIIGLSSILKKTGLTEKQEELLDSIENASGMLLGLMNDILDFAQIESGKWALIPGHMDLPGLLHRQRDRYGELFAQKGLSFDCHFEEGLPQRVWADESRMAQILENVLGNALKYTKAGGCTFSAGREGEHVVFAVRDTGIGIREADFERLFVPFEQLNAVQNKGASGTGLGLSITRHIVEEMGGSLSVRSTLGEGSCFTVRLPLKEAALEKVESDGAEGVRFQAGKARALLVDDIEINLLVAEALLTEYGLGVHCVSGGQQALEALATQSFDIVFLDHMMPEMDGIETARRIRELPGEAGRVPIVALTANAVEGAEQLFLSHGFQDYIAKPIEPARLGRCLLRWLPEALIQQT